MQVFKAELKDGIGDAVANSNSVAIFAEVSLYTPTDKEINNIKNTKAIAEVEPSFQDLYYVKSILASVGWNKNDDVFDSAEMWRARNSPVDKPFNYMHDEKDIIGHMVSCYAVDQSGNILPDFNDMSQVPSVFDIVTGSVLYKSWSDKNLKARMDNIIANIDSGEKWHVSMECLFPAFDYALIDPKGNQKIVKREESSAFLTKHLRAYGGKGEYEGNKVGRLLRNFTFSGVGLVEKPANPRSVILNKNMNFSESQAEEINMTDELELLKAELAEAKKAEEDAKKAKDEAEAKVKEAEEEKEKMKVKAKEDAEMVKKAAKEAEDAKKAKAETEEELKKMKKEKMMEKRKAELAEAGVPSEDIDNTVAQFESLAEEAFETVVAAIKKVKNISLPAETPAAPTYSPSGDDLYPRTKPNGDYKMKVGKAEEEVDANEADASALETAEASPNQIPMVDAGEEESVRSFASEWFSNKVLKSTANIK
jgi:hypothetical protein